MQLNNVLRKSLLILNRQYGEVVPFQRGYCWQKQLFTNGGHGSDSRDNVPLFLRGAGNGPANTFLVFVPLLNQIKVRQPAAGFLFWTSTWVAVVHQDVLPSYCIRNALEALETGMLSPKTVPDLIHAAALNRAVCNWSASPSLFPLCQGYNMHLSQWYPLISVHEGQYSYTLW